MKKILFFTLIVALSVACNSEISLSGRDAASEFLEDKFTGIGVQDGFELHLSSGDEAKVKIEADEKIIPHVKYEITGGILYFYRDVEADFPSNALVKIYVTRDSVSVLKASNSKVFIADTLKVESLELNFSNSSVLEGAVECRQLQAAINASTLKLSGTAANALLNVADGSLVETGLKTVDTKLNLAGGSAVYLYVSGELDIYARDKSRLYYSLVGVFRSVTLDDESEILYYDNQ
ncbi:MAG: DUF2807 domain-containing protein [Prevotellaceae bacterium]|jgi:hypothetical protein|nr:DUF2807 domain-containing protein [Prevotellaceae bacterium]